MAAQQQQGGGPQRDMMAQQAATAMSQQKAQQPNVPAQLNKALESKNIAEDMDEEELAKIGAECHQGYRIDLESKSAWDKQVDEWIKLAAQVKEIKTFPWPRASNIKYPLLATASMQFAARAYPSLVPADGKIVQFKVVGADPQGVKAALADKLAKHMNYQLLEDMCDWEDETDRLLIQLPIVGCLFRKTYFDPIRKCNVSKLIGPKDLVVNYWATSLEQAHRKTEIIPMTKNQLQTYINAELYCDVDVGLPQSQPDLPGKMGKSDVHGNTVPSSRDDTTPYVILEQHTYLDLDDDGYAEPYIVTFEDSSKKVLRIVARYDSDGINTKPDGDLISIEPVEYYTKYGFIPNPDGGFYDIGFGHLLGPINESANTLINQLVDAGTLSNLQAGFIGKGLRLKLGESMFQPGEWKAVNATGDDIKKQIFPLPVKEPSKTLFELLGMLVTSAKELASIAEIFTGKMPGQNTPATTTQSTIEQGMKVFTAIYKRIYRSLRKEFKKLFRLNSIYDENFEKAQLVLDEPISKNDYDPHTYDVCPAADPTASSSTQKTQKAQELLQLLPLGTINVMEATKRALEAQEQPNLEALLQQPQPQQDPKVQQAQAQMQMKQQEHQMDMQKSQAELQIKQMEAMMDQKFEAQMQQMKLSFEQMKMDMEARNVARQANIDHAVSMQEMQRNTLRHQQSMAQGEQAHTQKMTQMKEQADAKRQQGAMAGMGKPSSNPSVPSGNKGTNRGK